VLSGLRHHIDHIVFLMQENHAFDSLFGEYCPANSTYCSAPVDGIPAGTCVPYVPGNASAGCVTPYNFTSAQLAPSDMPHDWNSTHTAADNGSMDDFYAAEHAGIEPFGHYNGSTVPVYWDLAEEYGLGEDFFSSAASYSLPNHWFEVAPSAPNESYFVKTEAPTATPAELSQYLNESNQTPTIEQDLAHSKTSWNVYDFALAGYNASTRPVPGALAYSYWNPLAAPEQSYHAKSKSHFVPRSQFFTDASAGTLPNISWLVPSPQDSDHPPFNLSTGQDWVASVVDALERSPEWNSTVLFISWDEYGGFYDPVSPPVLDAFGDGFRVPLLAVGPWIRQGYVDPQQMDFSSILHLMEVRFHLPCLGPRDCQATLPLAMFDFHHGPRAPIQISRVGIAQYPMSLQSSGRLPYYGPASGAPLAPPNNSAAPLPPNVDWS
jgi:phospholipase C